SLTAPATPRLYTLSLHDALPIYSQTQDGNDLVRLAANRGRHIHHGEARLERTLLVRQQPRSCERTGDGRLPGEGLVQKLLVNEEDRKSTRLNSSHVAISYAVFCL